MITVNFTTCNSTIVVNNKTYVISSEEAKKVELATLLEACRTDENETNVKSLEDWLTIAQDVERTEIIDDLFLYNVKRDLYYFSDDTKQLFVVPSLLVDYISDLKESGVPCEPIINFFKALRKNPKYNISFANDALEALLNTYLDGDLHAKFLDKGYCGEVAYCDSSKNAFTLTSDGNVVAYKQVRFKNHKYDTSTGERIDRFPFSYDEESGEKNTIFPDKAEGFKIYPYSKKIHALTLVTKETFYSVGQVVNQSKGQVGFEKEESSLAFYGQNYMENKKDLLVNDSFIKVVINPITISSFGYRLDVLNSPIFQIVEFMKAPSDNEINLSNLNEAAETYADKIISEIEDNANKYYTTTMDKIASIRSL